MTVGLPFARSAWAQLPVADLKGYTDPSALRKLKGTIKDIYDELDWMRGTFSTKAEYSTTPTIPPSGVTAGTYGSASAVGQFTVNKAGLITAAKALNIAITASQVVSGTFSPSLLPLATTAAAGAVTVGSNISVANGVISLNNANVTGALGYTPVNKAGDTMGGKLNTIASATTGSGLNLPHGFAPTTPTNGDLWTTTGGLFAQINGATKGPFVSSVTLAAPAIFSVSGGTTGDAAPTLSLTSQSANTFWAGPSSGAATAPGFRAIATADLPTIPVSGGGTGQTTASAGFNALSPMTSLGDLIYGSTAGAGTRLPGNTSTARQWLLSAGTGTAANAPQWAALASGDVTTALGFTPLNKAGDTMTGKLVTMASTSTSAALNIAPGVAPATANNGDMWGTSGGLYTQVGGQIYNLLLSSSGGNSNVLTTYGDLFQDMVVSGGLPTVPSPASLTMTTPSAIAYVQATRVNPASVSNTYAASSDTYVDLSSTGGYTYSAVANNAAAPAVAANSIRMFKVTTNATQITAVTDLRQMTLTNQQSNFKAGHIEANNGTNESLIARNGAGYFLAGYDTASSQGRIGTYNGGWQDTALWGGSFNVVTGGYKINGSTVIDSSRNGYFGGYAQIGNWPNNPTSTYAFFGNASGGTGNGAYALLQGPGGNGDKDTYLNAMSGGIVHIRNNNADVHTFGAVPSEAYSIIEGRNTWAITARTYPVLRSNAADEWIMLHAPHIPYLAGGTAGYRSGADWGAKIRYADSAAATNYWDAGVLPGTSIWGISRNGGSALFSVSTAGAINAASTVTSGGHFQLPSGNGYGLRFWDTSDNYKIWMSATSDATWGGDISGLSDYNTYFKMGSAPAGKVRGFVFYTNNAGTNNKTLEINPNGLYLNGGLYSGTTQVIDANRAASFTSGTFSSSISENGALLSNTYAPKPSIASQGAAQSGGTISGNTYTSGSVTLTSGKKYLVIVSFAGVKDATTGNVALCLQAGTDSTFATSSTLTVQQISGVAANSNFSLTGAFLVSATSNSFPSLTGTPGAVRCYVYTPGATGNFTSLAPGSNDALVVVEMSS